MKLTRRDFAAGIAAGIVAPYVISSARAQGATLKIGMCTPVTGPAAESGGYAIKGAKLRLIECHISNVHTREEFRSHSFISPAAAGIVVGFGVDGYAVAIHGLHLLSAAVSSS